VSGGIIYVGTSTAVYAVNALTGEEKWVYNTGSDTGSTEVSSSPAVSGGTVYIGGSTANYVYALDAHTGAEKWKYRTGDDQINTIMHLMIRIYKRKEILYPKLHPRRNHRDLT